MILQRTIKKVTTISGIGLHSGMRINLKMRPATANTGIIFHRTDGEQTVDIKVLFGKCCRYTDGYSYRPSRGDGIND